MKRHRHSPEQALRKVCEGENLLNEGQDLTDVLRHLEVSETTWNRWRAQHAGMKGEDMTLLKGPRRTTRASRSCWPGPSSTRPSQGVGRGNL